MDYLPANEVMAQSLQPLIWWGGYWQDEDSRGYGLQERYPGVCQKMQCKFPRSDPGKDLEELRKIDTKAREVRRKYFEGLNRATAGELAVHRRVSRLNYSKRCADASVQAHMK